jgi:hypothetical protein
MPKTIVTEATRTNTDVKHTASRGSFSASELAQHTFHRRAVEAAIWGIPLVNYDCMYQAAVRDGRTGFNQIVYWSRPSDWKNQTLTPNGEVLYMLVFVNTKDAGPMVLEIPPADETVLLGSVIDSWQVPAEDIGPAGADSGKGGKYLILPPGSKNEVAAGYIPVRLQTYQSYAPLRTIPKSWSASDLERSVTYLKRVRLYPLAEAANPPQTALTDVAGVTFDSAIPYDLRFFRSLNRMIQEEPFQTRDLMATELLKSIGIEKRKPFNPDLQSSKNLAIAAQEAYAWFENRFLTALPAYYPDKQWLLPAESIGPGTQGTFVTPEFYGINARGMTFYWAFGAMKHLGGGSFYLVGVRDSAKQHLLGDNTYRLTVPEKVPAAQFWSICVYDVATGAFIRDSIRVSLSSFVKTMQRNNDGSTDIYFGPKAPTGKEANWIPTRAGARFFTLFRFYGPQPALFEKTWQLPDIEKAA